MVLSSMTAACHFEQPSITSVQRPTASCGTPSARASNLAALVRNRSSETAVGEVAHPLSAKLSLPYPGGDRSKGRLWLVRSYPAGDLRL